MTTVCITNCVNDARVPMRASYVNLYKWPESDAEFAKTVRTVHMRGRGSELMQPRVVDSVSCRQLYLRSYTFSKKESVPERTKKCFGKFRQKVAIRKKKGKIKSRRKRCMVRMKKASFSAFSAMFQKLLSCTASVDVVER